MMQPKWKTLEEQVRGIAELIFGQPCRPDRIAGVNFDGVIHRELETIIVEITQQYDLDKVRQGVTRLTLARQTLSAEGIFLRGYIVLSKAPTQSMVDAAKAGKVTIGSPGQFASQFFQFPRYKNARVASSFGSSIDPITGDVDSVKYVPVMYERVDRGDELNISDLADTLLAGNNIVLLGEYGAGKSRCVREVFNILAENWDLTFQFPFAVNLRECWGLERGDEIVRRAIYVLGRVDEFLIEDV